jgi:hypothetical protein
MQKNVAAFIIEDNNGEYMRVSHLVIGYTRVVHFYEWYSSLSESERALNVCDIFMYDDLDKALEDHMDAISREARINYPNNNNTEYHG